MVVEYFCPCRVENDELEHLQNSNCFYRLEYLYFCQDCGSLRCPKCVDSDPVCWYCPTCQYVVNHDFAIKWGNKCPRNCLECPDCHSNTIVQAQAEDKYLVHCSTCDFKYEGLEKRAFAGQILQKDPQRADFARLTAIYRGDEPKPNNDRDIKLPELVSLHARFKKYCKACRNVIIDPETKPGIKFLQKTMAWSHLPRFSVKENTFKGLNPLPIEMKITLKSNQVTFATTSLTLGPATINTDVDEQALLQQYSESQVTRQSTASRQVFMLGVRQQQEYGELGPNWCSTRFSVEGGTSPLVLATISYKLENKSHEINVWIRW